MKIKWERYGLKTRKMYRSTILTYDDEHFKTEIIASCVNKKDNSWEGFLKIDSWSSEKFTGDSQENITKQMKRYIRKWHTHIETFVNLLSDIVANDNKPKK